jgi:hypothetical protein
MEQPQDGRPAAQVRIIGLDEQAPDLDKLRGIKVNLKTGWHGFLLPRIEEMI